MPQIVIINHHNKPLTATPEGNIEWNRESIDLWEFLQLEFVDSRRVKIRSHHGKYLTGGPNQHVTIGGPEAKEWETWEIQEGIPGSGIFTIRSFHGYFLCATPDGKTEARPNPQDWEKFKILCVLDGSQLAYPPKLPMQAVIINAHHKPLTPTLDGQLEWNRPAIGAWEMLNFEFIDSKRVKIRSFHGKYLCGESGNRVVIDRNEAKEWETWELQELSPGRYALRSFHGYYLCVTPHGVTETRNAAQDWEQFKICTPLSQSPAFAGYSQSSKRAPAKVVIVNNHHKPLTPTLDGKLQWTLDLIGDWEVLNFEFIDSKRVKIRSFHGKFLSAEPNQRIAFDRNEAKEWETWEIQEMGPNRFALLSFHGYYLCVTPTGATEARNIAHDWESFKFFTPAQMKASPGRLQEAIILNHHHRPFTANPDGRIEWNRNAIDLWEILQLEFVDNRHVKIRSHHGKYLSGEPNQHVGISRPEAKEWETWEISETIPSSGIFTIRSFHGYFLCATPDGKTEARPNPQDWEHFQIFTALQL